MLIRPLLASDLDGVKAIDHAAFSAREQYDEAVYASMPQSGLSIVAQDADGSIAGYAFVHPKETGAHREAYGYIRSMAVRPDRRRRGVATALLEAVVVQANCEVDLQVDEDNEPAMNLYRSLGFESVDMCDAAPRRWMVLRRGATRFV